MENRVCDIKKNDKAWAFFYRPLNVWMTLTRVDVRLRTDYNEDDDYVADYLIAWGNNKKYISRCARIKVLSLPKSDWDNYPPHSNVIMEHIMDDEMRFKHLINAAVLKINTDDYVTIPNGITGKPKNFKYKITVL